MTGITKDELMQMAHEAGLIDFYNAILERAAVELEKGKPATVLGAGTEWGDGWKCGTTDALDGAQDAIRALKINTGD